MDIDIQFLKYLISDLTHTMHGVKGQLDWYSPSGDIHVDATCKRNLANISCEYAPSEGLLYSVAGVNPSMRSPLGRN